MHSHRAVRLEKSSRDARHPFDCLVTEQLRLSGEWYVSFSLSLPLMSKRACVSTIIHACSYAVSRRERSCPSLASEARQGVAKEESRRPLSFTRH